MHAISGDDKSTTGAGGADAQVTLGARVRVHPGSDVESFGVIIDDFGEMPDIEVGVGENQIAKPPRRWAVALDDGTLVFVDSDQITPN